MDRRTAIVCAMVTAAVASGCAPNAYGPGDGTSAGTSSQVGETPVGPGSDTGDQDDEASCSAASKVGLGWDSAVGSTGDPDADPGGDSVAVSDVIAILESFVNPTLAVGTVDDDTLVLDRLVEPTSGRPFGSGDRAPLRGLSGLADEARPVPCSKPVFALLTGGDQADVAAVLDGGGEVIAPAAAAGQLEIAEGLLDLEGIELVRRAEEGEESGEPVLPKHSTELTTTDQVPSDTAPLAGTMGLTVLDDEDVLACPTVNGRLVIPLAGAAWTADGIVAGGMFVARGTDLTAPSWQIELGDEPTPWPSERDDRDSDDRRHLDDVGFANRCVETFGFDEVVGLDLRNAELPAG